MKRQAVPATPSSGAGGKVIKVCLPSRETRIPRRYTLLVRRVQYGEYTKHWLFSLMSWVDGVPLKRLHRLVSAYRAYMARMERRAARGELAKGRLWELFFLEDFIRTLESTLFDRMDKVELMSKRRIENMEGSDYRFDAHLQELESLSDEQFNKHLEELHTKKQILAASKRKS